ncbi:hypothetical protein B2D07_08640 [Desulfococcus multivorans]|jgi:hypothetical protein|nr:uncharacterized protein Dmul_17430 [Desulfococcus multivorans]AQV00830.1 hypothetical protein B2D07_08640 [Desulfococcus multivorans]
MTSAAAVFSSQQAYAEAKTYFVDRLTELATTRRSAESTPLENFFEIIQSEPVDKPLGIFV